MIITNITLEITIDIYNHIIQLDLVYINILKYLP